MKNITMNSGSKFNRFYKWYYSLENMPGLTCNYYFGILFMLIIFPIWLPIQFSYWVVDTYAFKLQESYEIEYPQSPIFDAIVKIILFFIGWFMLFLMILFLFYKDAKTFPHIVIGISMLGEIIIGMTLRWLNDAYNYCKLEYCKTIDWK